MRSIDEFTQLAGDAGDALNHLAWFLQCRDFEAYASGLGGSVPAADDLRNAIQLIGRFLALPFTSGVNLDAARPKVAELNAAAEKSDWVQLKTLTRELLQILKVPTEPVAD